VNATQREAIQKVISTLEELKGDVDPIGTELREEFDNLPEKSQESEKGEKLDSEASLLEESADDFDSLADKLRESIS